MRLRPSLSQVFRKKIKCIILIDKRIKTSAAVYGKYHTKEGFTGLGAINDFTAGVYNTATKEYHSIQFQGAFEIVSLTGTVTRKDGDVYLHLHIAAGDEEGHVHGGHLNRAIISATAEIQIQVIDGEIGREFSQEIGLNLFKF